MGCQCATEMYDECDYCRLLAREDVLSKKLQLAVEALKFYSTQWRSDVYVGPTQELLTDQGNMAREALVKIKDKYCERNQGCNG